MTIPFCFYIFILKRRYIYLSIAIEELRYMQKIIPHLCSEPLLSALAYVVLDTRFERNSFNVILENGYDLPFSEYGVTGVALMALGIGEIRNLDIDAESGNLLFDYQLTATSVPLPASWLLFGSGIIGLIGVRKFF